MPHNEYSFQSKIWRVQEFAGWHFVNVPKEMSKEIRERFGSVKKRGWGAIPITATIGQTSWKTSIFPSKEGYYLLAVKQQVRQKENIHEDDTISVTLEIRDM